MIAVAWVFTIGAAMWFVILFLWHRALQRWSDAIRGESLAIDRGRVDN